MLSIVRFAMNSVVSAVTGHTTIPKIKPFLRQHIDCLLRVKKTDEYQQNSSKRFVDKQLRQSKSYQSGEKVLVETYALSKFAPRRDGPYIVLKQNSPTSYELAAVERPTISIGKYHVSALQPFNQDEGHPDPLPQTTKHRILLLAILKYPILRSPAQLTRCSVAL